VIIEAAKRIINSDKVCHSYSDLNFGVTFWNTVYMRLHSYNYHSERNWHINEVLLNTNKYLT